jgi:hypothetical protein
MNSLLKVMSLLVLAVGSCSVRSEAASTKHVLQGSYNFNGANFGYVAASTVTTIGPDLTVTCPGSSGTCTVQTDFWIGYSGGDYTWNDTYMCYALDGASPEVSECEAGSGNAPSNGSKAITSMSLSIPNVAPGTHIVNITFYTNNGAYIGYYNANARVYKP